MDPRSLGVPQKIADKRKTMPQLRTLVLVLNITLSNLMVSILWAYEWGEQILVNMPSGVLANLLFLGLCVTPLITVGYLTFEKPNMFFGSGITIRKPV